jgi:cellulose biosynthesis protein BcsQ
MALASSIRRSSAKRIAIFNHKGGVGKTTLTANVADAFAALGKIVLLVDADPQCNLTSYMVDPAVVDDLLDNSDGKKAQRYGPPLSRSSKVQVTSTRLDQ